MQPDATADLHGYGLGDVRRIDIGGEIGTCEGIGVELLVDEIGETMPRRVAPAVTVRTRTRQGTIVWRNAAET